MTTSERTGSRSDEPDGPGAAPAAVTSADGARTDAVADTGGGLAALARARAERPPGRRSKSTDDATTETLSPTPSKPPGSRRSRRHRRSAAPTPAASAPAPSVPAGPSDPGAGKAKRGSSRRRPSSRTRKPDSWWWKFGFPIALVMLIVSVPLLIWAGEQAVLQSNDGTLVAVNTDPTKPGWEAITPPTPTMLLVQVDDGGKPVSLTVLSQTGQSAGGVILVPVTSVLTIPTYGSIPLDKAYAQLGMDGLRQGVQNMLGVGMGEMQVIDSSQWADLMGAVGPLLITNLETVTVPGGPTFPKGPLLLQPDQVGAYLATSAANSVDTNRLQRQDTFWHSLLARMAQVQVQLPGDADKGLTHFLPPMAKSQVDVQTLPVTTVRLPGSSDTLFSPVPEQMTPLVAKLIPFPTEAALGTRPKARILDGTGKLDHGVSAAPILVRGGAQIAAVGNAANFDYTTTQLIYTDDSQKDLIDKLAAALGVGEVVKSAQQNADVDVTVILGTDFANRPVSADDTVITTPATNIGTVTVTSAGGATG